MAHVPVIYALGLPVVSIYNENSQEISEGGRKRRPLGLWSGACVYGSKKKRLIRGAFSIMARDLKAKESLLILSLC